MIDLREWGALSLDLSKFNWTFSKSASVYARWVVVGWYHDSCRSHGPGCILSARSSKGCDVFQTESSSWLLWAWLWLTIQLMSFHSKPACFPPPHEEWHTADETLSPDLFLRRRSRRGRRARCSRSEYSSRKTRMQRGPLTRHSSLCGNVDAASRLTLSMCSRCGTNPGVYPV